MHMQNFPETFEDITGVPPFPWQCALYHRLITNDFPQAATIPTGLGKTSIIAIWLCALATKPDAIPRRLVYVVNRRTVVDQTTVEVEKLRDALTTKPELQEVAAILHSLCAIPLPRGSDSDVIASPLAISTLRGQFADNREWLTDPARPAVVIGTVDMIGSGLLFSRYTAGFKSRPHQAAFLAQDALLVHDEAHLEPAFQKLLESIRDEQQRDSDPRKLRIIALTATQRSDQRAGTIEKDNLEIPFTLTPDDLDLEIAKIPHERFHARKALDLVPVEKATDVREEILERALTKNDETGASRTVLVFLRSVEAAEKVADDLAKKLGKTGAARVATLTGTMRGKERDELVSHNRVFQRFLPNQDRAPGVVYLIATSAGEVGINISADDLISDLSTYESMAQRFGRVNRFGHITDSTITVVYATDLQENYDKGIAKSKSSPKDAAKKVKAYEDKNKIDLCRLRTLDLLRSLTLLNNGKGDASPAALESLLAADRAAAFAPPPSMREATSIQFDAWALTSIRALLASRPMVAPYLHGEAEWELPETHIAWRDEVRTITGDLLATYPPEELLEDFPLKPRELLRDTSGRIVDRLIKIAERLAAKNNLAQFNGWLVHEEGNVEVFPLGDLLADNVPEAIETDEDDDEGDDNPEKLEDASGGANATKDAAKRRRDRFTVRLANRTLILPPSFGGLSARGSLSATSEAACPATDVSTIDNAPDRTRVWSSTPEIPFKLTSSFRLVRFIDMGFGNEDISPKNSDSDLEILAGTIEPQSGPPPKKARYWLWLAAKSAAASESRFSIQPESLAAHTAAVVGHARSIAGKMFQDSRSDCSNPSGPDLGRCLVLAAELHDLGKNRREWQRGIGNLNYDPLTPETILAKPGSDMRPRILADHYRHEFGSVADITNGAGVEARVSGELAALSELERDIVLHLVAAHHGRARPHFPANEIYDPAAASPETSNNLATEIPRRFARLQRHFGRWGLSWIESLLRAADYAASAGIEPLECDDLSPHLRPLAGAPLCPVNPAPLTPTISLRLDPTNPGHYFACCGLLELAAKLAADTHGWFSANGSTFNIACSGVSLEELLHRFTAAKITALDLEDPCASPLLIGEPFNLRLDWWQTASRSTASLKTWSGQMKCPSISVAMQNAIRTSIRESDFIPADLLFDLRVAYTFEGTKPKKVEPFYFDANRGPNAHSRDIGFAPNDLKLETIAAPASELLCLVGLQRATPSNTAQPRHFTYHLWSKPLSAPLLISALNGLLPDSIQHRFCFESWFRDGQRKNKAFLTAKAFQQPTTHR